MALLKTRHNLDFQRIVNINGAQKSNVGRHCGSARIATPGAAARVTSRRRGEVPEAICCFNDPLAVGAEIELQEHGIVPPADILISGFSATLESGIVRVPISSVSQDAAQLGEGTARLLFSRMIDPGNRLEPVTRVIKTALVLRESTAVSGRA